jgi:sugar transferase (PEP-CTERM/EpsH1 system associated)
MKILLISFDFPYPPTGGSISRDYNIIRQISKKHEIYWINRTLRGTIEQNRIDEMSKYCKDLKVIPWDYPHSIPLFIGSIFNNIPYIIKRFSSSEMKSLVEGIIASGKFDLILCDHIYLAQYLPKDIELSIPVIANNEDNGFTYYKRMSESGSMLHSVYGKFEWKKLLKYEVKMYNKYKHCLTTSETEKEFIKPYLDDVNIGVIKNGVDLDYFKPMTRTDFNPNIIFTAWFKYYPNQQAAEEFSLNVFPKIKKHIPNAKFFIVGKQPPQNIIRLGQIEGITVTGEVDDVRAFIANSDVAVIPLKVGGGTRIKILEAMAMGIPVVSTSLGAEGLEATNNENILIADEYDEMADKIVRLINNKESSNTISGNALNFVRENYDWNIIGHRLNDYLEQVVLHYKKS